jgi:putative FmdB family regulatory protein
MPIFEYRCEDCRAVVSALILAPADETEVRCPRCEGRRLRRVPSRFAIHRSVGSRIAGLSSAPADDDFYADPRNIGLRAKKRARDLGLELGSDFDEAVERARTTRDPEDL